jgi:signal transduction histidine kinase/AraC-like DNA-binding protein
MVAERTEQIEKDKTVIEQQAAELRKTDELKSRFFANVSHELRTPLTLIIGPLKRMLNRTDLPPDTVDGLHRMLSNGQRLKSTVNDIMDLTKVEEGKLEAYHEPTHVAVHLKHIVGQFTFLALQRSITLQTAYQFSLDLILLLDRAKVETIIRNLIVNALKHTPRGGQVTFSARYANGQLTINVEDTGHGIDERDLPLLFDRFYQARHGQAAGESEGGTGIGLAICSELVSLMGGEVTVTSSVGNGSIFKVSLPATIADSEARVHTDFEPFVARPQVQGKVREAMPQAVSLTHKLPHVLMVEDHQDIQDYLSEILSPRFYLSFADHGRMALDLLQRIDNSLPDLIITDLMMPVMNGFELLRHLKADPALALLPTIVLSARSAIVDRLTVLRTGVDDYLLKPFEEAELQQRISNLLANATARHLAMVQKANGVLDAMGPPPSLSQTTAPAAASTKKDIRPTPATADLQFLTEVETHFRAHIEDPDFGNEDLAALLFISVRTLSRRLKAMTGLSANKFMLEIRLTEARKLLEAVPRPTLSTIAINVGFRKASYFSSRFRQRFGVLPSEYNR